jgi:acyl-CoA dehydrogenase
MRPIALSADQNHSVPYDFLLKVHQLGFTQAQADQTPGLEREEEEDRKKVSQTSRIAVVASEEFCWGDPALFMTFPGPGLAGPPVRIMGTPEQRKLFFDTFRKAQEPKWGAYALSEPGTGSDAGNISTICYKDGDGYVIQGVKTWITNGDRADWVVVFATVDKSLGKSGHRAFLVPKGTPGFSVLRVEKKMGLRANGTAQLLFDNCRVPKEYLLGGEEYYQARESKGGFKLAMKTFDATRPIVGAMAVGIARAAWEETAHFFEFSSPFSRRPAPVLKKIRETLLELKRKIDTARLLCFKSAWMADLRIPNTKEASIAKAYAGQMVHEVTSRCMELMGIFGAFSRNYVEKCFRDQKVFDIFEGTGQIQRVVISRRILERLSGKEIA